MQGKNDYGDLLLYLSYSNKLQKLYVNVSKAYNLRPMDITGASGRWKILHIIEIYPVREICFTRFFLILNALVRIAWVRIIYTYVLSYF